MRSWLAVFLLVLLPLQFSWAAAGSPAPQDNEPVLAVHCPHPHCADSMPGLGTSAEHADCGTCHNGCPLALLHEPGHHVANPDAFPLAAAARRLPSRPADQPDRPQWTARG